MGSSGRRRSATGCSGCLTRSRGFVLRHSVGSALAGFLYCVGAAPFVTTENVRNDEVHRGVRTPVIRQKKYSLGGARGDPDIAACFQGSVKSGLIGAVSIRGDDAPVMQPQGLTSDNDRFLFVENTGRRWRRRPARGCLGLSGQRVSLGNGDPALFPEAHGRFPERFYVLFVVSPGAIARNELIDTTAGRVHGGAGRRARTNILAVWNAIVVAIAVRG